MVEENITISMLEQAREELIHTINSFMTDRDKGFLVSFKDGMPDWDLLDLKNIEYLPAVQWKLYNLKKMDSLKHQQQAELLKQKLYQKH